MEWKITKDPIAYPDAVEQMERRVAEIAAGTAPELVWLLEHPPLYTAGTSARPTDLLDAGGFPVYASGRGGQFTYHGPGQRIAYILLDLKRRAAPNQPDIRTYVNQLESWLIATLASFGVEGFTREGRIGVWVKESCELRVVSKPSLATRNSQLATPPQESKIAALGIRVRRWVTYHGIALNVCPDLSHYAGIVPCGIQEYGVTSLKALGIEASMDAVDQALAANFKTIF